MFTVFYSFVSVNRAHIFTVFYSFVSVNQAFGRNEKTNKEKTKQLKWKSEIDAMFTVLLFSTLVPLVFNYQSI